MDVSDYSFSCFITCFGPRVKDTVKTLLREQEQIHNQLKEENAEKEQYQVRMD